jgi:predicted nucleotidyltransferase
MIRDVDIFCDNDKFKSLMGWMSLEEELNDILGKESNLVTSMRR